MEGESDPKSAGMFLTREQCLWLIFFVGLPAVSFVLVAARNYEYLAPLFRDPRGRKMLVYATGQLALLGDSGEKS